MFDSYSIVSKEIQSLSSIEAPVTFYMFGSIFAQLFPLCLDDLALSWSFLTGSESSWPFRSSNGYASWLVPIADCYVLRWQWVLASTAHRPFAHTSTPSAPPETFLEGTARGFVPLTISPSGCSCVLHTALTCTLSWVVFAAQIPGPTASGSSPSDSVRTSWVVPTHICRSQPLVPCWSRWQDCSIASSLQLHGSESLICSFSCGNYWVDIGSHGPYLFSKQGTLEPSWVTKERYPQSECVVVSAGLLLR